MANVLHSSLTGAELHEPKGANGASQNTVYVANGSGSGAWSNHYTFALTTSLTFTNSSFNSVTVYSSLSNLAKIPYNCTVDAISLEASFHNGSGAAPMPMGVQVFNSTGSLHYAHAVSLGVGANTTYFGIVSGGSVLLPDITAGTHTYIRAYIGPSPAVGGTRIVTVSNVTVYFRQRT